MKKVVVSFECCDIYINSDYIQREKNDIIFYKNQCIGLIASVSLSKFRFKFIFCDINTNYYELIHL